MYVAQYQVLRFLISQTSVQQSIYGMVCFGMILGLQECQNLLAEFKTLRAKTQRLLCTAHIYQIQNKGKETEESMGNEQGLGSHFKDSSKQ